MGIGLVLWFDGNRMVKTVAGFFAVSWHGELHLSEGIVPCVCETKVLLTFPVL